MTTTQTTTAQLTATFARLDDGSWGLRVPGRVTAGQSVTAVRRDESRSTVTIGSVLCQATGSQPALCTIGASAPRSQSPVPARRSSGGRRAGRWTGCSCGSREDSSGSLIHSSRNCASCEHDA